MREDKVHLQLPWRVVKKLHNYLTAWAQSDIEEGMRTLLVRALANKPGIVSQYKLITICLPWETMEKIDEYATRSGCDNWSSALCILLEQELDKEGCKDD